MNRIYKLLVLAIALAVVPYVSAINTAVAFDECPKLAVICPDELPESGKTYIVKLRVEGADPTKKLSYNWSVSSGEIVDGQGTPTLKVRFSESEKSLTATVEVDGLPSNCGNSASCTFVVS
jgi:PKD-like domain